MQSHLGYPDSQRWQCGGRAMPWWIPIKFQLPARVQGCTCYNAKHKKKTCRLERSSIPEIVSVVTIILDSSSHSFLHHWVPRHPSDRYMDEQHTHSHVEGVFLSKGTTFEACISLFWIKRLWLKMSDAKVQRVLRFQISILGPILNGSMDCAPLEFNEINLQTSCWPPKNMIHCLQTQDDLWDQKLGQVPFEQLGSFEFQSSQLLSFWNGNATYLIAGLPFAVSFSSQVHLVWH